MSKRADMSVGPISASLTEHGVQGSFHASAIKEVRHFEKREKRAGDPKDHGCHEFNILEFEGSEGATFSVYVDTDQLGDLIEQAQAALDAIE